MAPSADDHSVDGSLSSVTESQWDLVDEQSAASEDDQASLSRQPSRHGDRPEHLHIEQASQGGTDLSSEDQGSKASQRFLDRSPSRKDSLTGPPDTARRTVPPRLPRIDTAAAPHGIDNPRVIKFDEAQPHVLGQPDAIDVSYELPNLTPGELDRYFEGAVPAFTDVTCRVMQRMHTQPLQLTRPFKVLFYGPPETKAAIVEKIASALAATLGSSRADALDSSRVTIVPISAFVENTAPDVVLIDSMGLDMHIDHCTAVTRVRRPFGPITDDLVLTFNGQKEVRSLWSEKTDDYVTIGPYDVADLAVVYQSTDESSKKREEIESIGEFAARMSIPLIPINAERVSTTSCLRLFPSEPRLVMTTTRAEKKSSNRDRVLPLDIDTFLCLDAHQMNRSLAYMTHISNEERNGKIRAEARGSFWHGLVLRTQSMWKESMTELRDEPLAALRVFVTAGAIFVILAGILIATMMPQSAPHAQSPAITTRSAASESLNQRCTAASSKMLGLASPKPGTGLVERQRSTDLATMVVETRAARNKSDHFKAHVVGDHHIVLQPPAWFSSLKSPPPVHFRVQRRGKDLSFAPKPLFERVYSLELDPEDGHGEISLHVWTALKPKINETFNVTFPTPWLKVVGWQRAAQALTEQVQVDLQAAQEGLSKAYGGANEQMQSIFKDLSERGEVMLREVERSTLLSLNTSARSAAIVLKRTRQLSHYLSQAMSTQIMHHGQTASDLWVRHRDKLQHDLENAGRQVASGLAQQARALAQAATDLHRASIGQKIQDYRESHFRESQKHLLHAWWRLRGLPQENKKGARRGWKRTQQKAQRSSRKSW